jgi:hypothetical protein
MYVRYVHNLPDLVTTTLAFATILAVITFLPWPH